MDLDTISMPRAEARKHYLDYREAIHRTQGEELDEVRQRQLEQDQVIATAYRQLSVGRQVIRLRQTIIAGGFTDQGRPRVAIMRADIAEVEMDRWQSGAIRFRPWVNSWSNRHRAADKVIEMNGPRWQNGPHHVDGIATLPPIPPWFRPANHLRNYHLLFEATWRVRRPAPIRLRTTDPALLKWMGGDLYAVLAVWDVSPVEAAALEGGWL